MIEKYENIEREHSSVVLDKNLYKEKFINIEKELILVTEKLVQVNKARNKVLTDSKFYERKVQELKLILSKNEDNTVNLKRQLERADIEIIKANNDKNELESNIANAERHYDHSQKQYEDKIAAITEISNQNKKKKESWASNYEKEQTLNSETQEELLKVQTRLKETEMILNTLKISSKVIKKLSNDNEKRNIEINHQLVKLAVQNEK